VTTSVHPTTFERVSEIDLIGTAQQSDDLEFFWQTDAMTVVGLGRAEVRTADDEAGVAALLQSLQAAPCWQAVPDEAAPPGPWFGGLAFEPAIASDMRWSGFPASRWVLPEILIWSTSQGTWRATFAAGPTASTAIEPARSSASFSRPAPDTVDAAAAFRDRVRATLTEIAAGRLTKLVVSRAIDLPLREAFSPASILPRLVEQTGVHRFMIRGETGHWLVGASPETLLRLDEDRLHCAALAGSKTLGTAFSEKEQTEHAVVVSAIEEALGRFADVSLGATSRWDLSYISHLFTPIEGRLRQPVTVAELVSTLHPTPAVAGWPAHAAKAHLRRTEAAQRGWYTGVVGWLGHDAAHLAVALRSALIHGQQARIFVGAGVIAGSTPDEEHAETVMKTRIMRDLLAHLVQDRST